MFPLLFAGGGVGAATNVLVPDLPLAFAVTAMMAAVPASVIPVPFSLATLTVLVAGVGATEASAVFIAAVVAVITSRGIESALDRRAQSAPAA